VRVIILNVRKKVIGPGRLPFVKPAACLDIHCRSGVMYRNSKR